MHHHKVHVNPTNEKLVVLPEKLVVLQADDYYGMRRAYTIVGSCVFYKVREFSV